MQTLATMIMASMAFQSALAHGNVQVVSQITTISTLPSDVVPCATPVSTTTTRIWPFHCFIACIAPTSSCSAGEATGPTPNPPRTTTLDASSGACTATVEVINNPGCGLCATCTTDPAAAPTATGAAGAKARWARRQVSLSGVDTCTSTATLTTTVGPQTTEICACPAVLRTCLPGQLPTPPLPTTTLTKGCVEKVVVGPGGCINLCPTCFP